MIFFVIPAEIHIDFFAGNSSSIHVGISQVISARILLGTASYIPLELFHSIYNFNRDFFRDVNVFFFSIILVQNGERTEFFMEFQNFFLDFT